MTGPLTPEGLRTILTIAERDAIAWAGRCDSKDSAFIEMRARVEAAFDAAVVFGDEDSIRELHSALGPLVREHEYAVMIATLRTFSTEETERGIRARHALDALEGPIFAESVEAFARSLALVACALLHDSRSGVRSAHRRSLIQAILDEAVKVRGDIAGRAA